MNQLGQNQGFNDRPNDVNQFGFPGGAGESADSSRNVSSVLSSMVTIGSSSGQTQPPNIYQSSMDYQQMQGQSQLSLNLEADLPNLQSTSQPVPGPSRVSQLYLPTGMTQAGQSLLITDASQRTGSVEIVTAPTHQVLSPITNMAGDQGYMPQSLPLLPVTSTMGEQNIQSTHSTATNQLPTVGQINLLPSIMSTGLSSGSRSFDLSAVGSLSMLSFPAVSQTIMNTTQVTSAENYVQAQVTNSQNFSSSHLSVSPGCSNAQVDVSGSYRSAQIPPSQSYTVNAPAQIHEAQNFADLPGSQNIRSSLALEIQNVADPIQGLVQHSPEQQLVQNQDEQLPAQQGLQLPAQQGLQLPAQQGLQLEALSAEAEPSTVIHHHNVNARTFSLPLGNLRHLDETVSGSVEQASTCSSNSDEPQPGPSSSQVFFHKATGKSVQIPMGTEAVASTTNVQQNQASTSLMEGHPEPSGSYSSSMFESLSPPDSTTHINVNDFLNDPSHALDELGTSTSRLRYHTETMSAVHYKENNDDGVSSTSQDHRLDLLMQDRHPLSLHPQVYQASLSGSLTSSSASEMAATRMFDRMNSLAGIQRSSPKCDDDSNMPSSSGILPSAEYESISDEDESEVTISRGKVTVRRVLPMYKSQSVPEDSLSSSLNDVQPGPSYQHIDSVSHSLEQISTTQQLFSVDFHEHNEVENREVTGDGSAGADGAIQPSNINIYEEADSIHSSTLIPPEQPDMSLDPGNFYYQENNMRNPHEDFTTTLQARDMESNAQVTSCQASSVEQNVLLMNIASQAEPTASGSKFDEFHGMNVEQSEDLFNRQQPHYPLTNSIEVSGIPGPSDLEPTVGTHGLQFVHRSSPVGMKPGMHAEVSIPISNPDDSLLPAHIEKDVNLAEGLEDGHVEDSDISANDNHSVIHVHAASYGASEQNSLKSEQEPGYKHDTNVSSDPTGSNKEDDAQLGQVCVDFDSSSNHLLQENAGDVTDDTTADGGNHVDSDQKQQQQQDDEQISAKAKSTKKRETKKGRIRGCPVNNTDTEENDNVTHETSTGGQAMNLQVPIEESQCIFVGGQRKWRCLLCPKMYTSKHNLVSHILSHNGIKPFHCNICGKYFKQAGHLYQHILTHGNVKPYICNSCDRCFTQGSHLKRHMAVHMVKRPNICHVCDRGFVYPSELKTHMERHEVGGVQYPCEQCRDVCSFETARQLRQHMCSAHGNVADLTCKECGKVFPYPSQLRDHMAKHSGKRPFQCGECGTEFLKEHHLKAHQFTHTGLRPFICELCGRAFNQKANLQRHVLIHQGDKNYKCEVCKRTFSQPQVLKAHMVTHADDKPYKCDECGKKFTRAHNLSGHMHMHRGNKPHVCFCSASFTLKGNLNRHKKEKHGITDTTQSTEEEAAKILNEMSSRKVYENEITQDSLTEHEETGDSSEGAPTPKKKRKSVPPRRSITQIAQDVEVEAIWDENPVTVNGSTIYEKPALNSGPSPSVKPARPNGQPAELSSIETVTTDVISQLMGSMTGEYSPPSDKHKNQEKTFPQSEMVEISVPDIIIETESVNDDGRKQLFNETFNNKDDNELTAWHSAKCRKRSKRCPERDEEARKTV